MEYFTKVHVHTLLNKMGLLREKITTYWKLLDPSCLLVMFHTHFGVNPFLHRHFLSIVFPPKSFNTEHPLMHYYLSFLSLGFIILLNLVCLGVWYFSIMFNSTGASLILKLSNVSSLVTPPHKRAISAIILLQNGS